MKNLKLFEDFQSSVNNWLKKVKDDSKNYERENKKLYTWYIKTNDIKKFPFYLYHKNSNPLYDISDFDKGDNWSIDGGGDNTILKNYYPEDPEDDSFYLIPKDEILDVWSE
jgi:hypothetical protein